MRLALHIVVLIITHSVSIGQPHKLLNISKKPKIKFVIFVECSTAHIAFERSLCFAAAFLIGQWMRDWCQRCGSANLYEENGLTVNDAPSGHDQEVCRELGRALAKW